MPDETLAEQRGGTAVRINVMDLDAKLTGNSAVNNVTGNNLVGAGAFENANGFATVIQNSGNNVIIQNATIINLEMR